MVLSSFRQYGNGQRVGFALVCIGFGFCFTGCVSPYWLTAKTSITDIKDLILGDDNVISNVADDVFGNTVGDMTLLEVNAGIWVYCIKSDFLGSGEKCYTFYGKDDRDIPGPAGEEIRDRFDWINLVRSMVTFNIILSFIAMCVACCRCMCCSGGQTICHGVLSFLAGGCGVGGCIIAYNHTKSLLNIPVVKPDYDWALSLFMVGSVMLVVASFLLCFAVPREQYVGGMILNNPMPAVSVNVSNSNSTHMTNQYVNAGQMNSFEPLPQAPPPYLNNVV